MKIPNSTFGNTFEDKDMASYPERGEMILNIHTSESTLGAERAEKLKSLASQAQVKCTYCNSGEEISAQSKGKGRSKNKFYIHDIQVVGTDANLKKALQILGLND